MHMLYKVCDIWIEKENKKENKKEKKVKVAELPTMRHSSTFDIQAELIHRP